MSDWGRWYNLVFLLPAGIAIFVLLAAAIAGAGSDDADTDVDVGDLGEPGDLDLSAAEDADDSVFDETGRQLLGLLGVGRAPLSLVLGSLLLGWGLFGLAANEFLRPVLGAPARFIGPSMAVAAIGALLTGRAFAELAARLMPKDESYAIRREGLLGLTGTVIFPVTETAGRVHVRDRHRTLHQVSARVSAGQPSIAKGIPIIVASMDPEHRYLIVEPLGFRK